MSGMSFSEQNESSRKFEIIDISGDVGLRVFGATQQELFVNASMGMYHLITNTDMVREERPLSVSVASHTIEGLLVAWLNELIFHFDAYGFVGKKVVIEAFGPFTSPHAAEGGAETGTAFGIRATVYGEEFDPEHHEAKLLLKAATYHRLKVERRNHAWQAEIIFDI